jgi:hypothetical protein
MIAQLDPHDRTHGTDPTGQQFEATLRTTADLDYPGPWSQSDLIEESSRFSRKFLGLLLQASLLNWAVAQKVLVILWQLSPHHLVEFSTGVSGVRHVEPLCQPAQSSLRAIRGFRLGESSDRPAVPQAISDIALQARN